MSRERFSHRVAVWLVLLALAVICGLNPFDATTLVIIGVLAVCLS